MKEWSLEQFSEELASKAPVPGGGGASAVCGALGCALGSMVGNLTVGKKKYAKAEPQVKEIMTQAEVLQRELLRLAEADAAAFEPLSRAYGLPRETPEEAAFKDQVMEAALKAASVVPLQIMECSCQMLALHQNLAILGSRLAVSDVGVGVQLCRSALLGASMNVWINTKMMKDREQAQAMNQRAETLMEQGVEQADRIFEYVLAQLR